MPHLPDITPHTPFRQAEKHYKARSTPSYPSLRHPSYPVLDLSRPATQEEDPIWLGGWWGPPEDEVSRRRRIRKGKQRELGERPLEAGNMEGIRRIELSDGQVGWVLSEGCILLPNYLDHEAQLHHLQTSLGGYTTCPNPLSIDTHYAVPATPSLFDLYSQAPETLIPTHFSLLPPDEQEAIKIKSREKEEGWERRKLIETLPGSVLGYEEIRDQGSAQGGGEWEGKMELEGRSAGELMKEIRWANLGWVYRWSTKSYDFTPDVPIAFPAELGDFCSEVIRSIPWSEVFQQEPGEWSTWADDYRPDTGIVNFYQMKDTLMGHVDRAELDPSRPLVSLSLGHSAIFLLGSSSRDIPPKSIILRSGDVLIMSGKGRQSYHGVPRIMEESLPLHFSPSSGDSAIMTATKRFISTSRININARQVFPPGFQRPV